MKIHTIKRFWRWHISLLVISQVFYVHHDKKDIERVRFEQYPDSISIIGRIKALRQLNPTLSIKDAKEIVESLFKES